MIVIDDRDHAVTECFESGFAHRASRFRAFA